MFATIRHNKTTILMALFIQTSRALVNMRAIGINVLKHVYKPWNRSTQHLLPSTDFNKRLHPTGNAWNQRWNDNVYSKAASATSNCWLSNGYGSYNLMSVHYPATFHYLGFTSKLLLSLQTGPHYPELSTLIRLFPSIRVFCQRLDNRQQSHEPILSSLS